MESIRTPIYGGVSRAAASCRITGTRIDFATTMAKTRKHAGGDETASESVSPPFASGTEDRAERSPERIAMRAYELYLARGGSDGQDFDDWLAAERELSSGPSRGDRDE